MPTFRGLRCSAEWQTVLTAAARAGTAFEPTSLQRTFSEQAVLRSRYEAGTGPLAAEPSHDAPHIRTGRPDHAADVKWTDGGVYRLAAWLRRQGCRVLWTVPGERWHIEVPRTDLQRLARKLVADRLAGYPADEKRWIRELDAIRRGATPAHPSRQRVLIRVMTTRRKSIWRAAQISGWQMLKRRARYRSLLARTT